LQAVRFHRRGGPEELVVEEIPAPQPGPGEALVRVHAAALNRLDLWVRRGLPIRMPMPHVGGADFAGVVEALGVGARGFTPGDAVVGHPLLRRSEPRPGSPPYALLGEEVNGAFCELLAVPVENLVRKPDALSFVAAAALPVAYVTAYTMLALRAGLRRGETLLVQGAGSGVGTAAVQIGRWLGARVIACTSSGKLERVRALGVDHVIDDRRERVDARVRELTGRAGADVVFEHVGEASFAGSVACAAFGGRIVVCGATSGRHAALHLQLVFGRELSILGVTLGARETLETVLRLAAAGELIPVIDRVLPLARCREAQEALEAGGVFGKIVLQVAGADELQVAGADAPPAGALTPARAGSAPLR
jgi:NADPH:quinone reductase-like Zn-dependent oxidoreductase